MGREIEGEKITTQRRDYFKKENTGRCKRARRRRGKKERERERERERAGSRPQSPGLDWQGWVTGNE